MTARKSRPSSPTWLNTPAQQAARIHVVAAGDSLSAIAQTYGTTVDELLIANGLPNANFVFVGQRLRVPASRAVQDMTMAVAGAPEDGARRIEVNLSAQTLTAYRTTWPSMQTTVSTGKWSTPTVQGTFHIGTKYASQDMYGDDYYLPGVPWVMYFYEGFAIHGAYWHANFGTPTSHGCVNMRPDEAEILFDWAAQGTEVVVYQ
ncbi:MAG: L,D-transpeptidase family protein [Caldilineaceae bacterium]